jgi:hypothetical protein
VPFFILISKNMHLKFVFVARTYFSLPGCKILPKAKTLNSNDNKGVFTLGVRGL